jgi:hypothetical protein
VVIGLLVLVAFVIGASVALAATHTATPGWFETIAFSALAGALGTYQPGPTQPPGGGA